MSEHLTSNQYKADQAFTAHNKRAELDDIIAQADHIDRLRLQFEAAIQDLAIYCNDYGQSLEDMVDSEVILEELDTIFHDQINPIKFLVRCEIEDLEG